MKILEAVCSELLGSVDAAVACGVLDLSSGHMLAMSRSPLLPEEVDDVFASAVADIFFNSSVMKADEAVRALVPAREADVSAAQEILITTAHTLQFAKRIGDTRAIVLLVTSHESNIGLAWAQLRSALPRLQEALKETVRPEATVDDDDPMSSFLAKMRATVAGSDGTVIIGQPQQPTGLILLDAGFVSWATSRNSTSRLSEYLSRNAVRPLKSTELKQLSEVSRREGRTLGESLLAAGVIDEQGLRRSYLTHCAQALMSLSRDAAARLLTWRDGALVHRQSPFRFSLDELVQEARQLA
jgi:hypothetical protein